MDVLSNKEVKRTNVILKYYLKYFMKGEDTELNNSIMLILYGFFLVSMNKRIHPINGTKTNSKDDFIQGQISYLQGLLPGEGVKVYFTESLTSQRQPHHQKC